MLRLGTGKKWIDAAWLGLSKIEKQIEKVDESLKRAPFALNMFDRASQKGKPGEIANAFREILSIDVAIVDKETISEEALLQGISKGATLQCASVSLAQGYRLLRESKGAATIIRRNDEIEIERTPSYLRLGDILLLPPSQAFFHSQKGLCFGDIADAKGETSVSGLSKIPPKNETSKRASRPQSLIVHTRNVMDKVENRLLKPGIYKDTLASVLCAIEGGDKAEELSAAIGQLAVLATGFHDFGKCGRNWQQRARSIDPDSESGLIGRTGNTSKRIGIPHTPPGFYAAVAACNGALDDNLTDSQKHLVATIALAAARHHSSLLDPSLIDYEFVPAAEAKDFIAEVLTRSAITGTAFVDKILNSWQQRAAIPVPLMVPSDDLFAVYALVGRAILIADREDASGKPIENAWRESV